MKMNIVVIKCGWKKKFKYKYMYLVKLLFFFWLRIFFVIWDVCGVNINIYYLFGMVLIV